MKPQKLILVALLLWFNFQLSSQDKTVRFETRIEKDGKGTGSANVNVLQNGKPFRTVVTGDDGKLKLDLPFGFNYQIVVSKPQLCTKKFEVSTIGIPEDSREMAFKVDGISLFELQKGIDYSVLNQTLLKVNYNAGTQNMDYDEAYFNQIQGALAQLKELERSAIQKAKEKEASYQNAIKNGDKQFQKKEWQVALSSYQEATSIKPEESYPKEQIANINKLIAEADAKAKAEAEAKAKAEAERLAKEKADADAKAKADADKLAKAKADADAKAKADADAKAKADAEAKAMAEAERLAKEKADADAKAKADAEAKAKADADKLAKEKADADAKTKADADAKAKAEADKLAKEKADADAKAKAEADKLAKNKAAADAKAKAEADKLAKEQFELEEARKKEALALKKKEEEERRKIEEKENKYKAAISKGDEAFNKRDWTAAKSNYNEALIIKPNDAYATSKLKEIESNLKNVVKQGEIKDNTKGTILPTLGGNPAEEKYKTAIKNADEQFKLKAYKGAKKFYEEALLHKGGDMYAKSKLIECEKLINSDQNQSVNDRIAKLLAKYPPGVTEETINGQGVVIIQRVVVKDKLAWVYQKKIFNWGGITCFRDETVITESTYEIETQP